MKLLFVHGRGQEGSSSGQLTTQWMSALGQGLERAGMSLPVSVTPEFPFYGDRPGALIAEVNAPLGLNIDARAPEAVIDLDSGELRLGLLQEFAAGAGLTPDDIARADDSTIREMGFQNTRAIRATARALDRVPGLNAQVIDLITRDVYVYLNFLAARRVIDNIIGKILEGDQPYVVVAHSLGSVVAYNVLREKRAPRVARLVTIGSPLALKALRRYLNPIGFPPGVDDWFNAYDPRDIVALRPLDQVNFEIAPQVTNYGGVVNYTENCHGIEGYLSDPTVAARIAEPFQTAGG
jgi:hypothetical protein